MKWKTGGSKRESESGNKKGFWCFAFNMTQCIRFQMDMRKGSGKSPSYERNDQ